jgi:hypothetical protein
VREQDISGHVFRSDNLLTSSLSLKTLYLNFNVAVKHHKKSYLAMMMI